MTAPVNFLIIQADQLNPLCLGAYGNAIARTPHIDALGDSGTVFETAYSNFPLCAPSRYSMLTGQICSKIGAYDNAAELPSSVPTFMHYLRAGGYQTTLSGKMHFVGADQLHGFEERLTTDIYPADFNWTGDWTEVTPKFANDARSFTQAGVCTRNVQMDYDEEVCHRAERKLYDLARSDDRRPFMLMVSLTHPHDPYQCLQEHWDRYRHDDIDMPVTGNILPENDDPYCRRLRALSGLDKYQPDDALIRIARHAYYGSVSYLDDMVGRLTQTLARCGFSDNTVVVFTSDHGDNLGERGLWYKKNFFEGSARVPLIISHPNISSGKTSLNTSLVDLLPTLTELSGIGVEPVEPLDGHSLVDLMHGNDNTWDDRVLIENLAEGAGAPAVAIKQGQLKYIHCDLDPPQLYDLAKDPQEINNLAGDPAHATTAQAFATDVHSTWSLKTLNDDIILSQKRRLFLREVLRTGTATEWDFVPADQADGQCLRAGATYNDWAYDNILHLDTKS